MAIRCPYCQHAMELKGVHPGRFTPACKQCGRKFLLTVPENSAQEPAVAPLKAEGPGSEAAATMPPAAKPALAEAPAAARPVAAPEQGRLSPAEKEITGALGGYVVLKRIGKGGMGSIYLARQVSLDRDVAVKVMNPQWAHDAEFVARFTREAYAAAQLVHHNVVQIHDIGVQDDTHYFSMEFVDGRNLADLVRQHGKLDPEVAAGYILQAARALKFAHDHGMVHRDIKPENLLLNHEGIVKVADLGLVKSPGVKEEASKIPPAGPVTPSGRPSQAHVTQANAVMGTPAYMAPEQTTDAAHVDARADIYSLGCTFYDLVTGRPPFDGKSVDDVLTKHQSEPVVPPERLAGRVPAVLSNIIMKMIAKRPEDRYKDAGEVIRALESFLGIDSAAPFTPREEHARVLESNVEKFNASPKAKLRRWLIRGFYLLCAALVALMALTRHSLLAGGFLGLMALTTASYIVLTGVTQKTHLFRRMRQLVFGAGLGDWAMGLLGAALLLLALYLLDQLWIWLGFCIAAVGLALGLHAVVDLLVRRERRGPVEEVEKMLKAMRLRGLEEDALRQFVCKYSGARWEEFYEALFGYESKMEARERWGRGERGRMRRKHAAWRDALIQWADRKLRQRQEKKEKKLLAAIEEKELKALGIDQEKAHRQAAARAEAMVERAAALKATTLRQTPTLIPGQASGRPPMSIMEVTRVDDTAARQREKARIRSGSGGIPGLLFGARTRFILSALLLTLCILWLRQNDLLHRRPSALTAPTAALRIPLLTASLSNVLFNSVAPGVAGVVLLLSLFWRGWGVGLLVLVAAAIILAGPLMGIKPLIGFAAPQVSLALGGCLALAAFTFARA